MSDTEGYGVRPGQGELDRLLEDIRTMSPSSIERAAAGWDLHGDAQVRWHEAERAALHALEAAGRGSQWDDLRNRLLGLTERGVPLLSWRAEHGAVGHRAEQALLGAALALLAGGALDRERGAVLRRPLGQALPWLLAGDGQD